MECIFIGSEFYWNSGTMMSSIYKIDKNGYYRTDWGKVEMALRNGESVNIRPATETEKEPFYVQLGKMKQGKTNVRSN